MSEKNILLYGASGYTGKLVAQALADRGLPFYFAGRNQHRLEEAVNIVESRGGKKLDVEVIAVENTVDELLPLVSKVDVVINTVGPFMTLAWPVVEACLLGNTHYLDTTGEQDWALAVNNEFGQQFAEAKLLLCPANAYMWAAGALAAEVCLEDPNVDSLDIVYKPDNGLPSVASTQSFLRMQCNPDTQFRLEQNELVPWPNNESYTVALPYVNQTEQALPWGGACEPIWYKNDPRVRNCKVLTAIGPHIVPAVLEAVNHFNANVEGLSQAQREDLTTQIAATICQDEPQPDHLDVQRSLVVCHARGRISARSFVFHLPTPYTWTGELCAEGAQRIINGQLKTVGFCSAAKAFGHRELLKVWSEKGVCNYPID